MAAMNTRTGPPAVDLPRRALLGLVAATALPAAAAAPGHEWRPWPPKRALPPLALPVLDGTRWQLADQRGRVVVVNFWATWCEPCRAEMPSLQRLAARHAQDGLAVVAVNYRETLATIRRFVEAAELALPVLLDADGAAALAWTPRIFPSTVLIGRNGRPAGVVVGEIDWEGASARALLVPLLTPR